MDFSSLNMENIEGILSSMSSEDMDMLKNMAQSLFSSGEQDASVREKPAQNENPFSSFNIDFETLGRIMSLMERLRSQPQNPGCKLLLSLKPMLSESRRGKIDEAVRMMALLSFLPIIDEMRGNGNG